MEWTTIGLVSNDEKPLARGVLKNWQNFVQQSLYLAENVEDNSNGIVFNFMVTMEDKHKYETATYQTKISMHVIVPSNIRSVTIYDDGKNASNPIQKSSRQKKLMLSIVPTRLRSSWECMLRSSNFRMFHALNGTHNLPPRAP
jgi:hypothetical protein